MGLALSAYSNGTPWMTLGALPMASAPTTQEGLASEMGLLLRGHSLSLECSIYAGVISSLGCKARTEGLWGLYIPKAVTLRAMCVEKTSLLRAGFEPATYGSLHCQYSLYSPPLYQLSYRREHMSEPWGEPSLCPPLPFPLPTKVKGTGLANGGPLPLSVSVV